MTLTNDQWRNLSEADKEYYRDRLAEANAKRGRPSPLAVPTPGALAANARQRPLDGADDLGDSDVVGAAGQPVAALRAALALHDAGVAGVFGPGTVIAVAAQNILQKLLDQANQA